VSVVRGLGGTLGSVGDVLETFPFFPFQAVVGESSPPSNVSCPVGAEVVETVEGRRVESASSVALDPSLTSSPGLALRAPRDPG